MEMPFSRFYGSNAPSGDCIGNRSAPARLFVFAIYGISRLCLKLLAFIFFALSGGCDFIGPSALESARPSYNEMILQTTKNQNFLNLVRVHEHEPTLFMDVGEVDVQLQLQGSVNGQFDIPQARAFDSKPTEYWPGHDYTATGSIGYGETPTIRFLPLSGEALVRQISDPITVDSVVSLVNGEWSVGEIFNLVIDRFTLDPADYYQALDLIRALDNLGALTLSAKRSAASGPDDTLVLYCTPAERDPVTHQQDEYTALVANLWHALWVIYEPCQTRTLREKDHYIELRSIQFEPERKSVSTITEVTTYDKAGRTSNRTWTSTWSTTQPADESNSNSVNTGATGGSDAYRNWPVLKMRSAMGVLRVMTQADLDWDLAVFVNRDQFEKTLKPMVKHFKDEMEAGRYRHDHYDFDSGPFTDITDETANPANDVNYGDGSPWYKPSLCDPKNDLDPAHGLQDLYDEKKYPERGDRCRHFLIVVWQNQLLPIPSNAYAWAKCGDRKFYIDGSDVISKRNFALISHLLTVQAVAQPAPLTPTLGIGAP